jgi:bifunctional non-homologous end joining protein LigD
VPGVPWDDIRRVALVVREVLDDMGLVGWPKTSGSRGIHINVRIERRWSFDEVRRAALALAREVERRAPAIATSKWWKEERHGVFIDYNQNAKDRTVASAYSVRPVPDARVSAPVTWDELPACELGDFTLATVPARFAAIGDPAAGMDGSVGSLERCSNCPRGRPRPGRATRRGRPLRQGARRAAASHAVAGPQGWRRGADRQTPAAASPPAAAVSDRPPRLQEATDRDRPRGNQGGGAGRFERWKSRHEDVVPHLEPADLLVDSMRGRFTLWYRIRVNLEHVPVAERPTQEPLDADYDPWAEVR